MGKEPKLTILSCYKRHTVFSDEFKFKNAKTGEEVSKDETPKDARSIIVRNYDVANNYYKQLTPSAALFKNLLPNLLGYMRIALDKINASYLENKDSEKKKQDKDEAKTMETANVLAHVGNIGKRLITMVVDYDEVKPEHQELISQKKVEDIAKEIDGKEPASESDWDKVFQKTGELKTALKEIIERKESRNLAQTIDKTLTEPANEIYRLIKEIGAKVAQEEFEKRVRTILNGEDDTGKKKKSLEELKSEIKSFRDKLKVFNEFYIQKIRVMAKTMSALDSLGFKGKEGGLGKNHQDKLEKHRKDVQSQTTATGIDSCFEALKKDAVLLDAFCDEIKPRLEKLQKELREEYDKLNIEKYKLLLANKNNSNYYQENHLLFEEASKLATSQHLGEAIKELKKIVAPTAGKKPPTPPEPLETTLDFGVSNSASVSSAVERFNRLTKDDISKQANQNLGEKGEQKQMGKKTEKPGVTATAPKSKTLLEEEIELQLTKLKALNSEKARELEGKASLKEIQEAIKWENELEKLKKLNSEKARELEEKKASLKEIQEAIEWENELEKLKALNYAESVKLEGKKASLKEIRQAITDAGKQTLTKSYKEKEIEMVKKSIKEKLKVLPGLEVEIFAEVDSWVEACNTATNDWSAKVAIDRINEVNNRLGIARKEYGDAVDTQWKTILGKEKSSEFEKSCSDIKALKTLKEVMESLASFRKRAVEVEAKIRENAALRQEFDRVYLECNKTLESLGQTTGFFGKTDSVYLKSTRAILDRIKEGSKEKDIVKLDIKKLLGELETLKEKLDEVRGDASKLIVEEEKIINNTAEKKLNEAQWASQEKIYDFIHKKAKDAKSEPTDISILEKMFKNATEVKKSNDYKSAFELLSNAISYGERIAANPKREILLVSRAQVPVSIEKYRKAANAFKIMIWGVIEVIKKFKGADDADIQDTVTRALQRLKSIYDAFDAKAFNDIEGKMEKALKPEEVRALREEALAIVRRYQGILNKHPSIPILLSCPFTNKIGALSDFGVQLELLHGNFQTCAR
ncbi:MAG: hypothetical protein LBS59_02800 [Puniceicoccales bacterium]|jgi:thiol-disulfide isomerase/thioredoxin|nr:hypothetical protein [Puniceicoccales bacterium]